MKERLDKIRDALLAPPAAGPASDPPVMDLIGKYWDLAYTEGKTGVSQSDAANELLHQIRCALAPPAAVPEGYALVPVEPTTAMKCRAVEAWEGPAVYKSIFARGLADLEDKAAECWAAMLAAALAGNKENGNG